MLAGTPALAALGAAAVTRGPIRGGPVKAAIIGTGGQGSSHVGHCQKEFINLKALCDVNPRRRQRAVERAVKAGWPPPAEYDDWREMLEKEDLEAVIIATPLWAHADISVGCLNAGKHVLCEKMMAKTEAECAQMIEAARRNNRVLEIGYQRYYNPVYQAAYHNIIKQGVLGEVYYARTAWHRNHSWRRPMPPPSPDFDASRWGYPDWEHLSNWRMYKKYSEGLMAELGSHKMAVVNWFFDGVPESVYMSGGINRFKDGREVFDHVYATYNYAGGRTATFTSIQSNAFEGAYETFEGTRGTLILRNETEAYLFNNEPDQLNGERADQPSQDAASQPTRVEVSPQGSRAEEPVADASATRAPDAPGRTVNAPTQSQNDKGISYQNEIAEFCSAIRTGSPLRCGPERAMKSAITCLMANRSAEQKALLEIPKP